MYCECFFKTFRISEYQNCGYSNTPDNCKYKLIYPIIQAPVKVPSPPPSEPIENSGFYGIAFRPTFLKQWFSSKQVTKNRLNDFVQCSIYPLFQGRPTSPQLGGYYQNLYSPHTSWPSQSSYTLQNSWPSHESYTTSTSWPSPELYSSYSSWPSDNSYTSASQTKPYIPEKQKLPLQSYKKSS